MPVEGQWQRANTPLSRRDKRLLGGLAVLAAAGAAAAGIALATHSGSSPAAGCVVVDVPSTMGGARLRNCGAAAHRFCRTEGRRDPRIADACRRQGFAADLAGR